jgi:hypothetical protein
VHFGPLLIVQFAIGCAVPGIVVNGTVVIGIVENPIIFKLLAIYCNL